MQLLVNTGIFLSEHEAVLNNLDWWQHRGDKHHYYAKEAFEEGLSTFDGLPIVFSNINHPRAKSPGEDINKYLKDIDGRIVGYTKDAVINNMGSPKLFSKFDITDKEVDSLISAGDIYLSSAFWYDGPKIGSISNIRGDHVLLFQRSKGGVRGDQGAMILNAYFDDPLDNSGATHMADGDKTDPPAQKTGDPMASTFERMLMTNQEEIVNLQTENRKLTTDLTEANKLITNKDEEITRLNKELEKVAAERKKNDQKLMLNSLFVQGTVDHFKDHIEAGDLDDPAKSMTLLSEMGTYEKKLPKPNLQDPSGNNFMANRGGKTDEEADEDAETLAAMNDIKSVVGR